MSETIKATRKPPVRRVFGRLKGIEICGALWVIEMTKSGVVARRKRAKKKSAIVIGFYDLIKRHCGWQPELFPKV